MSKLYMIIFLLEKVVAVAVVAQALRGTGLRIGGFLVQAPWWIKPGIVLVAGGGSKTL